jgi:hypothetical protein
MDAQFQLEPPRLAAARSAFGAIACRGAFHLAARR